MPRGHVLPDRDTVAMLRGEAGLTQQNLADRTGYGVRTISKIESGQPTSSSALAAIAIVLAESLGRPIQLVDLVCQRPGASPGLHAPGGAMLVAENIKLLELRSLASSSASTATGSRPRSVLIDTFRLRYLPANLGEIDFHYAAMGKALSGRSLSHPERAHWLPDDRPHHRPLSRTGPPRGHVLRVTLPATAKERPSILQNRVEYVDAFDDPDERQFHTHVVYPTDCLTFLVRFPEDRPAGALRGRCRRSTGGPLLPANDQPIDLATGRMAYWRIMTPTPGETYELDWT